MDKKQLKAITEFKETYQNLENLGLYIFLHENSLHVCKQSDINQDIEDAEVGYSSGYGDEWHQVQNVLDNDRAKPLGIEIDSYSA